MAMVRKQIYIEKKHDQQLKRLAKARGVSEAEVIRDALDQQLAQTSHRSISPDDAAWAIALSKMRELHALGPIGQPGRRWTREELYEDRLNRYGQHPD